MFQSVLSARDPASSRRMARYEESFSNQLPSDVPHALATEQDLLSEDSDDFEAQPSVAGN